MLRALAAINPLPLHSFVFCSLPLLPFIYQTLCQREITLLAIAFQGLLSANPMLL